MGETVQARRGLEWGGAGGQAGGQAPTPRSCTTVRHLTPPYETVPPPGYGGVERVVHELALAQRRVCDLTVEVAAPAGSAAGTVPDAPQALSTVLAGAPLDGDAAAELTARYYEWSCATGPRPDVLHAHGEWLLAYPELVTGPVVMSIYADTGSPQVAAVLRGAPENVHLVANSRSTAAKAPGVRWSAVVLEGVLTERYPFREAKDDYLLFVGELRRDKGCHVAIEVARRVGLPLVVIGRRYKRFVAADEAAAQASYFHAEIEPHLEGDRVRYLGELGDERLSWMARARALISPIQWAEPYGRVLVEAMACGTPVVVFRRGAAPEVVSNGVSGFVVDGVDEMVAAVRRAGRLSPRDCRAHVERDLDMSRVAVSYAALYHRVTA